ncbi:uncharacterized protein LOC144180724 [Haemaphysalis longicornis]
MNKVVPQISTAQQTYSCEAFHSLMNQFAPKTYHYSYGGMQARVAIAALHYNENRGRKQAETETGELRWAVRYRKGQQGEASLTAVKKPPTYGYVRALLQRTLDVCTEHKTYKEAFDASGGPSVPPPCVAAEKARPSKEDVVKQQAHRSRFNK